MERKAFEIRPPIVTFERYATDHGLHPHCVACSCCLLNPCDEVRLSTPLWCVSCKHRIEDQISKRPGVSPPWAGGVDFETGKSVPR